MERGRQRSRLRAVVVLLGAVSCTADLGAGAPGTARPPEPNDSGPAVDDRGHDEPAAPECEGGGDCDSGVCVRGECVEPRCDDGVANGAEVDVDCGGPCPSCADGLSCATGSDCASGVCADAVCAEPSCEDGVPNGRETDADCGGPLCAPCAVGLGCTADEDCESGSCRGTDRSDLGLACGATIVVGSAVYAANCGAAVELGSVGETCDGQLACDYTTNYAVDPGYDPNYGCPKDLTVTWSCGDDRPAQSVYVPGEAGTGAVVHLSCE